MEFADDGDLQGKVHLAASAHRPIPEDTVLSIASQVILALAHLHDQGVLHRDLKTANVFLTKSGAVKLGDFGVSRILDDHDECLSARRCQTPVGTPMYMSPELSAGAKYGHKTDIWSLGCILYEMMTLQAPFAATSFRELTHKIKLGQFSKKLPPYFSEELRSLVMGMISLSPEARPSARALLDTPILKKYFEKYSSSTSSSAIPSTINTPTSPAQQVQATPRSPPRPSLVGSPTGPLFELPPPTHGPGISNAQHLPSRLPRLSAAGLAPLGKPPTLDADAGVVPKPAPAELSRVPVEISRPLLISPSVPNIKTAIPPNPLARASSQLSLNAAGPFGPGAKLPELLPRGQVLAQKDKAVAVSTPSLPTSNAPGTPAQGQMPPDARAKPFPADKPSSVATPVVSPQPLRDRRLSELGWNDLAKIKRHAQSQLATPSATSVAEAPVFQKRHRRNSSLQEPPCYE
jgi:serine/threonine protein kinase